MSTSTKGPRTIFYLKDKRVCELPYPILDLTNIEFIQIDTHKREFLIIEDLTYEVRIGGKKEKYPLTCSVLRNGNVVWRLEDENAYIEKVTRNNYKTSTGYAEALDDYNYYFGI